MVDVRCLERLHQREIATEIWRAAKGFLSWLGEHSNISPPVPPATLQEGVSKAEMEGFDTNSNEKAPPPQE